MSESKTETYKMRSWPWKHACGTEQAVAEVKEPMDPKAKIAEGKKVCAEFVELILTHPKKKSSRELASQEDINQACYDAEVPSIDDQSWQGLRPDKKTFMIRTKDWANGMVKAWKKKPPSDAIFESVISKMKAFNIKIAEGIKTKEAERVAVKKERKIVAAFFDALVAENHESCDEQLKATPWLLNFKNRDKGFSTPVMVAVRENAVKSVEYLIKKECDMTIEDSFNWTALNWAVENDNEELQKILKDAGCKVGSGAQGSDDESDSDGSFNAYAAIAEA